MADLLTLLPQLSATALDTEFREFEAPHMAHKIKMSESWDFYNSRQWPDQIARELIARGQFPLVINKVYPAIQHLLSYLTANRPTYVYLPRQRQSLDLAWIHNEVGKMIWDRSRGHGHFTRCVLEMLVGGVGWMQAYVDPILKIPKIQRIPSLDVYTDPASQGIICEDASATYIRKIVTKRHAKRLLPMEFHKMIDAAPTVTRPVFTNAFRYQSEVGATVSRSSILTATGDVYRREDVSIREDLIQILERYANTMIPLIRVTYGPTRQFWDMADSEFPRFMEMVHDPVNFTVESIPQIVQRHTIHITGVNTIVQDVVYPIDTPLLIPFFDNHLDSPMAEGEVEHLKGLSMERNKRRSLMIHQATTSSNSKWLVQDGSTEKNEFENKGGRPGAVLYWRQGYDKPTPVFPLPMPEVLHYLETQADKDLQEVSGAFSGLQGDPKQMPSGWGAMLTLDEYGGRRPALKQRQLDDSLSALGQAVLKLSQIYMTREQVLRVTGTDGRVQQLLINSKVGDEVWNDITQGDWDVVTKSSSTLPTNREAKFHKALDMKREGIYDDIAVLKYMDDPEANEIIQRKSILAQVAQQNQSLNQQAEKMTGELANLEQMVRALQRQLAQEKATKEIDAKVAETMAKLSTILAMAKQGRRLEAIQAQQELQALQKEVEFAGREQSLMQREAEMATTGNIMENLRSNQNGSLQQLGAK